MKVTIPTAFLATTLMASASAAISKSSSPRSERPAPKNRRNAGQQEGKHLRSSGAPPKQEKALRNFQIFSTKSSTNEDQNGNDNRQAKACIPFALDFYADAYGSDNDVVMVNLHTGEYLIDAYGWAPGGNEYWEGCLESSYCTALQVTHGDYLSVGYDGVWVYDDYLPGGVQSFYFGNC